MTEIEITEIPTLTPGEQSVLTFHSVINILNVLNCELIILGMAASGDDQQFASGLALCDALLAALRDPGLALRQAEQIDEMERVVFAEIDRQLPMDRRGELNIDETLANLRAVFAILKVRARELLARAAVPTRWVEFDCEVLRQDFHTLFAAMERSSRGRFRIRLNAAQQEQGDYYVDFRIESAAGARVRMPPVLQDVMRDLIANARKYTPLGGHITAAFYAGAAGVRFVVRDDGRGIPPDEIRKVVAFGQRASNVDSVRTLGGGFGLSKAFLVTKQFGGRFWIASELGRGTQVRLWIPSPPVHA